MKNLENLSLEECKALQLKLSKKIGKISKIEEKKVPNEVIKKLKAKYKEMTKFISVPVLIEVQVYVDDIETRDIAIDYDYYNHNLDDNIYNNKIVKEKIKCLENQCKLFFKEMKEVAEKYEVDFNLIMQKVCWS